MSKPMTEKKVLKMLGIENFRQLSRENVMQFASMIPEMDPEVAKKALEQFPAFASAAKSAMDNYREVIHKAFDSNDSSMKAYQKSCDQILDSMDAELQKEDLKVEDRMNILSQMKEMAENLSKKDSENKAFLLKMAGSVAVTSLAIVGIIASPIGGNTKVQEITEGIVEKLPIR